MGNFSLTELALDAIPKWRKARNIDNIENQLHKVGEECGELSRAILNKDEHEIKLELGDCFISACVYYDIMGTKPQLAPRTDAFYGSNVAIKIAHFHRYLTISCLYSIAKSLKVDLVECANLAYQKIINREGQTIDGIFVKNPEYVRGND
jgi:hypothetical protein